MDHAPAMNEHTIPLAYEAGKVIDECRCRDRVLWSTHINDGEGGVFQLSLADISIIVSETQGLQSRGQVADFSQSLLAATQHGRAHQQDIDHHAY